jgi:type III secretion protein V
MFDRINKIARALSGRSDLIIAMIVLTAVTMMIIPLPPLVVDFIITMNIAIAALILLVGFYITTPMQFSSLPGVILISTVFRLAISITTTRLILGAAPSVSAPAGHVVQTFGEFVIGGNVAVGLVIFFIITCSSERTSNWIDSGSTTVYF